MAIRSSPTTPCACCAGALPERHARLTAQAPAGEIGARPLSRDRHGHPGGRHAHRGDRPGARADHHPGTGHGRASGRLLRGAHLCHRDEHGAARWPPRGPARRPAHHADLAADVRARLAGGDARQSARLRTIGRADRCRHGAGDTGGLGAAGAGDTGGVDGLVLFHPPVRSAGRGRARRRDRARPGCRRRLAWRCRSRGGSLCRARRVARGPTRTRRPCGPYRQQGSRRAVWLALCADRPRARGDCRRVLFLRRHSALLHHLRDQLFHRGIPSQPAGSGGTAHHRAARRHQRPAHLGPRRRSLDTRQVAARPVRFRHGCGRLPARLDD
ncbi:MAG: hypothetical protein IOMNBAOH_02075 [Rhodocyclaceae bacterium]|nr:hypothetical protein [Rhodocyclaceae bacterium]